MTPFWFVVVVANIVGAQCFSHILTSDLSLFFSPFLVLDICIATTGIELLHPNSPQCILEKKNVLVALGDIAPCACMASWPLTTADGGIQQENAKNVSIIM